MKEFGKFTAFPRKETIPGPPIGLDADGKTIHGPDQSVNILVFLDSEGRDWFDLAKEFPHKFYIAIDDSKAVVSMVDDFQSSQIAGLDIIGIDNDYGFSFGPGGNVYGRIWNGTAIIEPGAHTETAPDEISRRQFFQYLAAIGIITKAEALAAMQGGVIPAPLQAIIDQLQTEDHRFEAQMFIVGSQNFNRLHWLTDRVRIAMQWTIEQRDDFWRNAAKI